MPDVVFLITRDVCVLELKGDFLVDEIDVLLWEDGKDTTRLLCHTLQGVFPFQTFVRTKTESMKRRMVIGSCFSSGLSTSSGVVRVKGTYVQDNEVEGDIVVVRELYFRVVASNAAAVVTEEFDIDFFAATENDKCCERVSIVLDVGGRDATMCTLSHGLCSNASFKYTYERGTDLQVQVIGQSGSVSFVGSIRKD